MSFGAALDRIMAETPGAVACTLMGFDGIAIDSREADGGVDGVDLAAVSIEIGNVASQLQRAALGVGGGPLQDLTVNMRGLTTVVRPVNDEYFLAVTLTSGGLVGKGRYLLRVLGPGLAGDLV